MTDADFNKIWRALRKKLGFGPLSPAEAQAAYDSAPECPVSPERIEEIVRYATESQND